MLESDDEDKNKNNASSVEFQEIKKSDENLWNLNINEKKDQEYENEDFENFNEDNNDDGWIPSNQAAVKSKATAHKEVKPVKVDEIPMSESKYESDKAKTQLNNWEDLEGILEEDENERKEEKKKIQMMIFDEEDFESENN
jgi:hypothetical protein